MSLFKSSKFDITSAKILATLAKFFYMDPFSISQAEAVFERYKKYKLETDKLVSVFNDDIIHINSLISLPLCCIRMYLNHENYLINKELL